MTPAFLQAALPREARGGLPLSRPIRASKERNTVMSIVTAGHLGSTKKKPVPIITLGSGHRMRVSDYVNVWRYVKEAADAGRPVQRCDLTHPFDHRNEQPTTIALGQFRDGMHDRINRRGDYAPKGRKTGYEWETAAMRVAQFVNGDPRRAYHPNEWRWIPRELRRAFHGRSEP